MQASSTRLEIDDALATLGSPAHAAAGGSGAALAGALAASVVAKAARVSARAGSAAQAVALEDRLLRFAEADAAVLGEARAALGRRDPEDDGDERRDFALGTALRRALLVPCSIGEACADVAELAAEERETVAADYRADLAAAAAIAAGAAHAAAHLVAVNLIATPDDADVVAARRFAARATAVAGLFGGI